MVKHGIAVRCWTCGTLHDVRELQRSAEPLPVCCFDSLVDLSNNLGSAMIRQLPHHVERLLAKQLEFSDAVADAAVTSPNPAVRKAAQDWRNERAAKKSDGG